MNKNAITCAILQRYQPDALDRWVTYVNCVIEARKWIFEMFKGP